MVRWCCWRCCHCLLYACRLVLDFDVVQFTTRLWLIGGPCEFKPCIQHSISAAAWNALVSVCRCERKSSGVLLLLLLSHTVLCSKQSTQFSSFHRTNKPAEWMREQNCWRNGYMKAPDWDIYENMVRQTERVFCMAICIACAWSTCYTIVPITLQCGVTECNWIDRGKIYIVSFIYLVLLLFLFIPIPSVFAFANQRKWIFNGRFLDSI